MTPIDTGAFAAHWEVALPGLLVALTPREPSEPLDLFAARPRPPRIALVVGTEGAGLAPSIEAAADARVRIPTHGAVDSLNLAVAVGIALYALRGRA